MAAKSMEEGKQILSGMVGSTNVPVNISCFELIKPSFDETSRHCSLDVLPIVIEETSFPMREKCRLNTAHGQDVYSISVMPEEGNKNPKCTPQLTFLSLVEVPFSSKNQIRVDAQLSCHNCIDLKVDSEDAYSSCVLDINIEKEIPDILTSTDEIVGNSKSEGVLKVKFGDIDIDLSDVES
ncbi:putative mitochondrial adenine nucleotide transporter BTL3-like isoform X1 [Hibiscus syriacus]|uniref:Mitochondrial adenine nucleotide transporter BTL3-like isoform X1 n=1 Tax=Hibiscus syriacus TaxID=106335 RepID=A0A6A2YDM6_HIBSY|nr:putative mitochondrial adenine nucleotide transporter BTL3-like isoform X1 [Hibiscus syriacus]